MAHDGAEVVSAVVTVVPVSIAKNSPAETRDAQPFTSVRTVGEDFAKTAAKQGFVANVKRETVRNVSPTACATNATTTSRQMNHIFKVYNIYLFQTAKVEDTLASCLSRLPVSRIDFKAGGPARFFTVQ